MQGRRIRYLSIGGLISLGLAISISNGSLFPYLNLAGISIVAISLWSLVEIDKK